MPFLLRVGSVLAAQAQERVSRTQRPRVPEPMVMDDEASVAAFHTVHPRMQLPVYRLNALAMSALLPDGGTVLDLGSGSGRLLAHLSEARPDVRATGTDLAETMLAQGRSLLDEAGVSDRIRLHRADITELPDDLCDEVDLISTVWALHHMPTEEHLRLCLGEIARLRDRTGCAVWIFDFARLRREQTFPAAIAAIEDAPERLREDAVASERAAWSIEELRQALGEAGLGDLRSGQGKGWSSYLQAHFAPACDGRPNAHATRWSAPKLPLLARLALRMYRRTLPSPV